MMPGPRTFAGMAPRSPYAFGRNSFQTGMRCLFFVTCESFIQPMTRFWFTETCNLMAPLKDFFSAKSSKFVAGQMACLH